MTYTTIVTLAKTGLTSQSRLPVKKALAVVPALKLVSAAASQSLPRLKHPHASSVRCPAPAASTSPQRKVSPSTIIVPSARQIESIAKHLKRSQPVSKSNATAVLQRRKPSHHTSVKTPLLSRSLSSIPSARSESTLKVEKSTDDQVLEAFHSLRISSPVSTVPLTPGPQTQRRTAELEEKPAMRQGPKSCLTKKYAIQSISQVSQSRRPVRHVHFGSSSTCTFPEVKLYTLYDIERWRKDIARGQGMRLTQVTMLLKPGIGSFRWIRYDEPVETPKAPGEVIINSWGDAKEVRGYHPCACQLASYCTGHCRALGGRGGFDMPDGYFKSKREVTWPLLRCSRCRFRTSKVDRSSVRKGSHIVMASSADVLEVPTRVATNSTLAGSGICECTYDDLSPLGTLADAPYDWNDDPDIF